MSRQDCFGDKSEKRSHSVCAQGGINAAMNLKNEDDSPLIHAYDTIKGGDFLADQPPVFEMCLAAPGIIRMLERFGCPFNRTPEGNLDFRRFGGTLTTDSFLWRIDRAAAPLCFG